MTAATTAAALPLLWLRARAASLLAVLVVVWVFCGALVVAEPSPYELTFLLLLAVSTLTGFTLHRGTLGLLVLLASFVPFAAVAAFQVRFGTIADALTYQAVTVFLFFTAYWIANYVAEAPEARLRLVVGAWLAAAILSAGLGTLGYMGVGHDVFTRYDRAKALFNDPNVYGPFLVLPAMFALQRALLGAGWRVIVNCGLFALLALGGFVSFSRGAWGHLALSAALVFVLGFGLEAGARQKVRMLLIGLGGAAVLAVALAGALSIPSVREFFELRTQEQTYDTGESGRFGRQGYAFELALEHPLGLGPLEFRNLRIDEEPHNTYVNVLHAYGWGGGLAVIALIGITLWRGIAGLARPGPARPLLIPLVATFVPLAAEAAIIDIDHWRHFFLLAGLIWGVTAMQPGRSRRIAPIGRARHDPR